MVLSDAIEDARRIRQRIDALADAAADLLRDVRRDADRLTAELGFEPELLHGTVEPELTAGDHPEPEAVATPEASRPTDVRDRPERAPEPGLTFSAAPEPDEPEPEPDPDLHAGTDSGREPDAKAEPNRTTPDHDEDEPSVVDAVVEHDEDEKTRIEQDEDEKTENKPGETRAATPTVSAEKDGDADESTMSQPCPACDRTGRCQRCDGSGRRLLFKCSACKGSGRCSVCGGPGFIWSSRPARSSS